MRTTIINILFTWLAIIALGNQTYAQVKALPVTANTTLAPPYTAYLSDYSSVGANKLMVSAIFNDFNESSVDVYLHVKISSNLVTLETKPNFKPINRTTLTPGVSKIFRGADFASYLNFSNLNLTGITLSELNSTGRLPDGNYQFCVTVKEYNSGRAISRTTCTVAFISKQDPPLLTTPAQGITVTPQTPQNITFQWQLKNPPPGGFTNVEYLLKLYEITDNSINPMNSISASKVLKIYETGTTTPITTTNFNYNITQTLLEEGKRYAWTITIREKNGRQSFKNDGVSQVGWIQYGLPAGGIVELKAPEDGHGFEERENKNFKWKAPDNVLAGNKFKYELKIVELSGKSPKDAIDKNSSWYTFTSSDQSSLSDFSHTMTSKSFEKKGEYAWQVKAYSGTREIAKSEIRSVLGPPLIKSFYAGNEIVKVISTTNKDLTKLDGTGEIVVNSKGDKKKIKFSGINVGVSAGQYVLKSGTIISAITLDPITVTPFNSINDDAIFYPDSVKLTKNNFTIKGTIKLKLPHPVKGGQVAYIVSDPSWLNFEEYKLLGSAKLSNKNDFDLLDLGNSRLKLRTTSDFLCSGANKYKMRFDADFYVNPNVHTSDNQRLSFFIKQADQLYYFNITKADELSAQNILPLVQKANIYAQPKKVVIDLDETQSPGQHSSDKIWKGVYYQEFTLQMQTKLDDSKQQILESEITQSYNLNSDNKTKLDIDAKGLQCALSRDFKSSEKSTFNLFPAELKNIQFTVTDNKLKGTVTGNVIIPFISESTKHNYTIPLNDQGFNAGAFDKSLDGTIITFSPNGGEQKQIVTIKRAVFADNERLDCTIDVESPVLKHTFKALTDFRIYGDMFIGYGKRSGSHKLSKQVKLKYEGFNINAYELGASLIAGNYALSIRSTAPLGDDVAGKTGPPIMDFSSVTEVKNKPADINFSDAKYSSNKPEVPVTIKSDQDQKSFAFEKIEVDLNSSIIAMKGSLELRKGDPYWGTVFKGDIKGKLKVPADIELGASMILGTKEALKYWYFDAYFNDTQGMGVSVMGFFNIVAMEGRVYRHMNQDTKTGDFIIDKDIDFGAGLYMQMIDPSGGKLFKVDIAAELEVKKSGFIIDLEGDLSMLNASSRTPGAGGVAKKAAAKEVAKEIAKQLGPIEVTVPIGSDKMKLKASAESACITYITGATTFGFAADISSAAGATLSYKNGSDEFNLSGSRLGSASFKLKTGSSAVGLAYDGANVGSIDFDISGFKLKSSFDKSSTAGEIKVAYASTKVELGANATEGKGNLYVEIDASNSFGASFDKIGAGKLNVKTGELTLTMEANKVAQTGKFGFTYNSTLFSVAADKKNGSGSLVIGSGTDKLEASGDKVGKGRVMITDGSAKFELKADKPAGTGSVEIIPDANTRLFVALDKSGSGEFEALYKGLNLKVSADKTAGKGSIFAKYGSEKVIAKANKQDLEGYFSYANGSDSVSADLSSTKMKVEVAQQGTYFMVDADKDGNGNLEISKGVYRFKTGLNNDVFSVMAKDATKAVYVSADEKAQTGMFALKVKSDSIYTAATSTSATFYSDYSGTKFFITGDKSGSGKLALTQGTKELKIDGDVTKKSGSFFIKDGSDALYLAANQSAATGKLAMKIGSDSIKANLNTNEADLAFSYNGVSMGIDANRAGSGKISYSQNGKAIVVDANVVAKTGTFKYSESAFDLQITTSKEFDLNIGSTNFHLNFGSQYELKKAGTAVAMGLVNNMGTHTFTENGYTCTISSTSSMKSLTVKKGTNTVKISLDNANNGTLALTDATATYTAERTGAGAYKLSSGSKSIALNSDKSVELKDGATKELEISSTGLTVKYDSYNLAINATSKEFTYSDGTYGMSFTPTEVKLNDKIRSIKLKSDKSFEFAEGTSKKLTLSKDEVSVKYDSYVASFGTNKSLSFSDGTRSFAASTAGLSLSDGTKTIKLNKDKSASYADGTKKSVKISTEGVDLKYDSYTASFSKSKDLNFSDGTNSFALNPTKMELKTGSNSIALENKNGVKSISATDGTNTASFVSTGTATVDYGSNKIKVNGTKMLELEVSKHKVAIDKGSASYTDGNVTLALGEGNDLIKASKGTRSLAITKDSDLELKDGKYLANVSYTNKSIKLSDGTRTITAGGTSNLISYKEGSYLVSFYKATSGQYGLKGAYDGNTLAVEAGRSKTVKVIASNSSIGEISVSANSKKDIILGYEKGSDDLLIETGSKDFKVSGSLAEKVIPGGGTGAKDPKLAKEGPKQKGPKYLKKKITSGAAGVKGKVKMHYDSGKDYLLVSGAVSSAKPICISGTMVIESKKGDWNVAIGSKAKQIEIFPTCSGFGGGGFLLMDKKTTEVGVYGGFKAGGCVGIGIADICARASLTIFAEAKFTYSPSFAINRVMVGADFRASLTVEPPWPVSNFTIGGVRLHGKLEADFDKEIISGELNGSATVLGCSKSFNMGFSMGI